MILSDDFYELWILNRPNKYSKLCAKTKHHNFIYPQIRIYDALYHVSELIKHLKTSFWPWREPKVITLKLEAEKKPNLLQKINIDREARLSFEPITIHNKIRKKNKIFQNE